MTCFNANPQQKLSKFGKTFLTKLKGRREKKEG